MCVPPLWAGVPEHHNTISQTLQGEVADRLEQPLRVEPVNPGERRVLDCLPATPRPLFPDHLGLAQPFDGLGHGIVVGVARGADRRCDPISANRSV